MAILTEKQERFAQLVVELGNNSDAYRGAYNASNMKPETINSKAYILLQRDDIGARVAELRKELEEANLWSREDSLKVLAEIAQGNDLEAKSSDKINAVKAINQMHGWDKQVIDVQSSDRSMSPAASQDAVLKALERKHQ